MATIVTRAGKGSPLTHEEVDANFTNLNDEAATKAPLASPTFTGDVSIADKIVHSGDTNTAIRFPANDTVTIETSGAERLRVTSAGRVGVGTASPSVELDVIGSIRATVSGTASVIAQSGDTTDFSYLRLRQTATESRIENFIGGTGAYTPITVHAGGSERMRITSAGNVGINKTSPTVTLDVVGRIRSVDTAMILQSTGDLTTTGVGYLSFRGSDTVERGYTGFGGGNADFYVWNANNANIRFGTNATERMRITSAGNVGIGTTAPAAKLEVVGTAQVTGALNVGGQLLSASSGTTSAPAIADATGVSGISFPSGHVAFSQASTERMRINPNGAIGIGGENYGTSGQVLTSGGSGAAPSWADVVGVPAGSVVQFAMNTAPTGWLKANGAAVSRTTYATLFAAINTTFGSGDGSTTFNLPDLRGEFLRGWDDGRGVDSGRAFGSAQLDQMQKITGNIVGQAFTVNTGASSSASGALSIGSDPAATVSRTAVAGRGWNGIGLDTSTSPNARVSSTTSGETRARNIALLACIKF